MAALPQFRKFDIHDEPTSLGTRWKTWISEFQNLILALGVRDKKRQRALLLYYAGSDVHNIYKTLITETQQDEDFEAAKAKLDLYFEPKVNITYEVYHFRRMKQGESETAVVSAEENIDSFVTRLQEKAVRCGFQLSNLLRLKVKTKLKSLNIFKFLLSMKPIWIHGMSMSRILGAPPSN